MIKKSKLKKIIMYHITDIIDIEMRVTGMKPSPVYELFNCLIYLDDPVFK